MKALRHLVRAILLWSLVYTPSIFAGIAMPKEQITTIATRFNEKASTVHSLLESYKKENPDKIKELEVWLKNEQVPQDLKLPRLTPKKQTIEFDYAGKTFKLKLYLTGEVEISHHDKTISIGKEMTMDQMKDSLNSFFKAKKEFSLLSLAIEKVYADPVTIGIAIAVAAIVAIITVLAVTADTLLKHNAAAALDYWVGKTQKMCEDMKSRALTRKDEKEIRDMLEMYNEKKSYCNRTELAQKACDKLKEPIACLEELGSRSPKINDYQRKLIKDFVDDLNKELTQPQPTMQR